MSRVAANAIKFVHDRNPAEVILESVGDISDFVVHGPRLLVAVYDPSLMAGDKRIQTESGFSLIAPDLSGGTMDEYKFQGRACLVLAKGPCAFKSDDTNNFHGDDVNVGDWIVIKPLDGNSISIGKQMCRLVNDHHVQMTIPHPDAVF